MCLVSTTEIKKFKFCLKSQSIFSHLNEINYFFASNCWTGREIIHLKYRKKNEFVLLCNHIHMAFGFRAFRRTEMSNVNFFMQFEKKILIKHKIKSLNTN